MRGRKVWATSTMGVLLTVFAGGVVLADEAQGSFDPDGRIAAPAGFAAFWSPVRVFEWLREIGSLLDPDGYTGPTGEGGPGWDPDGNSREIGSLLDPDGYTEPTGEGGPGWDPNG